MSNEAPDSLAVAEEAIQPTETPESPETVDALASPEPGQAGQPAETDKPRDDKGRFAKRDGMPAQDAAATESLAVQPPAPTTAPPTAPPATALGTPVAASEPFTFRAAGQRVPIPGSSMDASGNLTIPADQLPNIRQLFASGYDYQRNGRARDQDYERRIQEAGAVQEARATKYNDAAVHLWERINDPEWLKALVADPERELTYLRREMDLRLQSADLKAPKAEEAPATPDTGQLEQAARGTLAEYVDELLETPQAKALYTTDAERKEVHARYARRLRAYFVERDGAIALHENAVDEDFQDELKARQAASQAASEAAKAAAFNAKRNQPAVTAPPVASTKGATSTGTNSRVYKTADEYKKAMGLH